MTQGKPKVALTRALVCMRSSFDRGKCESKKRLIGLPGAPKLFEVENSGCSARWAWKDSKFPFLGIRRVKANRPGITALRQP